MELTEAIKDYVEKKVFSLEKMCERFDPCDIAVEVGKTTEHHKNGKVFFAEFNITIPGGMLRSQSISEDLYASIDKAKDDVKRQLIERKERLTATR